MDGVVIGGGGGVHKRDGEDFFHCEIANLTLQKAKIEPRLQISVSHFNL